MPRTVIIADGEVLLALELSHALTERGFAVLGQARTLAAARKLLRVRLPAAALISAELADGETGLALARDLQACAVHVVLTAWDPVDGWDGPFLTKPYRAESVIDLLTVPEGAAAARTAAPEGLFG